MRALRKHGWRLMRVQGSHHFFAKAGLDVRLSVPIHGNKPLKKGLAHHLLKSAGLSQGDI
jgi:predicted RNA binding protein YcfA (HicA-like mRNA interferase family)